MSDFKNIIVRNKLLELKSLIDDSELSTLMDRYDLCGINEDDINYHKCRKCGNLKHNSEMVYYSYSSNYATFCKDCQDRESVINKLKNEIVNILPKPYSEWYNKIETANSNLGKYSESGNWRYNGLDFFMNYSCSKCDKCYIDDSCGNMTFYKCTLFKNDPDNYDSECSFVHNKCKFKSRFRIRQRIEGLAEKEKEYNHNKAISLITDDFINLKLMTLKFSRKIKEIRK